MISYQNLQKLLKRKGMSLRELSIDKLKTGSLGRCNTRSVSINTKTLDKICSILHCNVEDVVSFEAADSPLKDREKYLSAITDFSPLFTILNSRGISMRQAAMWSGIGRDTIGNIKKGVKPRYAAVRRLAAFLSVNPEELYIEDSSFCDNEFIRKLSKYNNEKADFTPLFSLIKSSGISIASLSRGAGITLGAITNIRYKGSKPKYMNVCKMAKFLGVEPEDLFTAEEK